MCCAEKGVFVVSLLPRTVQHMLMLWWLPIVVLSVAGAASARRVAELAAWRAAAQPSGECRVEQVEVLELLVSDPAVFRRFVGVFDVSVFTGPCKDLFKDLASVETAEGPDLSLSVWRDRLRVVWDRHACSAGVARFDCLQPPPGRRQLRTRLVSAGRVLQSAEEARQLSGRASPVGFDKASGCWVRTRPAPSPVRVGLLAVVLAAVPWVVSAAATVAHVSMRLPGVLAAVSLGLMLVGAVLVALVDVDTFFVDSWLLWPFTAGAWLFASAAALAAAEPARIVAGAVSVLVVVVVFEVMRFLLSGRQGFGDTLLVLLVCGPPAAVFGDPALGLWIVLAAYCLFVAVWVVRWLAGRARADTPMPFAPFLAAGWVLLWAATAATSAAGM